MSSSITPTATTSIQDFTKSILQKFDANRDGQFSVEEFSNFLGAFMKSVAGSAATTTASTGTVGVGTPALLSSGVSTSASRLNDPLPPCPPGWDERKWVDPERQSIKYVAGRIMARYSPSDWVNETTREQILADFRAAGLNPTATGKDKCDFNDGYGAIDIVQSASIGGKAWQWLPVSQA
jgi:hypothetical protein